MPSKQNMHPSRKFLIENLLRNAYSPVSSSSVHQLAGISELEAQTPDTLVSWEIEVETSSESSESDSDSNTSGKERGVDDEDIVDIFLRKDLDVTLFPRITKSVSTMKFLSILAGAVENVWCIVIFLAYCASNFNLEPCLELLDNIRDVDSFIRHIQSYQEFANFLEISALRGLKQTNLHML